MLFFRVARILFRISKDEGDKCLPFLVFWRHIVNAIFLKYSKKGTLSSIHEAIRNFPSDVCYSVIKHYQVQSERRRTQNPFNHLRWSVFAQIVTSLRLLTGYAKDSILDVSGDSEYASAAKQGRRKASKKNSRRRYVSYNLRDVCFEIFQGSAWLRNVRFENLWVSFV